MPALGVSINMISLFAFIVVLGIVVDDAIVVGENIYTHQQRHGQPACAAAIDGAQEVAVPVIFAVLTTMAAFVPLLNVPGPIGQDHARDPADRDPLPALLAGRVAADPARPTCRTASAASRERPAARLAGAVARFQARFAARPASGSCDARLPARRSSSRCAGAT